ncbi:hypothetical protein FJR70_17025 [Bacillus tropicus]|nr:hypothetical protein FJR70_17025 [Bacillus tropicus]
MRFLLNRHLCAKFISHLIWKKALYPALTGSKTPPQNSAKAKKLGGESTARKSPIGSTNNQWAGNNPTD